MKPVESVTHYQMLANDAKHRCRPVITNCDLDAQEVGRRVSQERFFYEEYTGGVIFYSDEMAFYEAYYYANPQDQLPQMPGDKAVLVKNIYTKDHKGEKLQHFEKRMREAGYNEKRQMLHIEGDSEAVIRKIEKPYQVAKRLLEMGGFQEIVPGREHLFAIRRMQYVIPMIPFYEISYYTDEELLIDAEKGNMNAIVDRNGELCAVSHRHTIGKASYGWIAVKEEYRQFDGLGICLTMHAAQNNWGNGLIHRGWVGTDNCESMSYHLHAGYYLTGRAMGEWICEPAQAEGD